MTADTLDQAQILEEHWQKECLRKTQNTASKQREYTEGDNTDCTECGDIIIPQARLEAGYLTCISCAEEIERKRG